MEKHIAKPINIGTHDQIKEQPTRYDAYLQVVRSMMAGLLRLGSSLTQLNKKVEMAGGVIASP